MNIFLQLYQVGMVKSIIELLLETLPDLSNQELNHFRKCLLQFSFQNPYSKFQSKILCKTKLQDTVFSMVQIGGQIWSLEKTKEVLEEMKRTDLVQRLSVKSSEYKGKDKNYLTCVINL